MKRGIAKAAGGNAKIMQVMHVKNEGKGRKEE